MAKTKTGTIIRPAALNPILIFNSATLIIAASVVIGGSFITGDAGTVFQLNIALIIIACVFWSILLITTCLYFTRYIYYTIRADGAEQTKFNRKHLLKTDSVLFIDELWSRQYKRVYLLTKEGKEFFFADSKDCQLLEYLLANCRSLLSEQEVSVRFPTFKFKRTREEKRIIKEEEKRERRLEKEAINEYNKRDK